MIHGTHIQSSREQNRVTNNKVTKYTQVLRQARQRGGKKKEEDQTAFHQVEYVCVFVTLCLTCKIMNWHGWIRKENSWITIATIIPEAVVASLQTHTYTERFKKKCRDPVFVINRMFCNSRLFCTFSPLLSCPPHMTDVHRVYVCIRRCVRKTVFSTILSFSSLTLSSS